jgi:hypothetical protein
MQKVNNFENPLQVEVSEKRFNSILNSPRKNRKSPTHICAKNNGAVLVRVTISIELDMWNDYCDENEFDNVSDNPLFFWEHWIDEEDIDTDWLENELYETVLFGNTDYLEYEWENYRQAGRYSGEEIIDFDCYVLFINEQNKETLLNYSNSNQLTLFSDEQK